MREIELKNGKNISLDQAFNLDCMELLKELPDNCIDLVLTDPQYGINAAGNKKSRNRKIKHAKGYTLDPIEYKYSVKNWDKEKVSKKYIKEIFRVSKNQIIFGVNYFSDLHEFTSGRIVWDKVNGDSSYSDCEIAYCSYHDSTRLVRYMWNGMLQGKSISDPEIQNGNKTKNEKRIHPTQKPVKLFDWILKKYSSEGDIVLDPFMGSFSTAISCSHFNLQWLGCEKDKEYFRDGYYRYEQEIKQILMNFS